MAEKLLVLHKWSCIVKNNIYCIYDKYLSRWMRFPKCSSKNRCHYLLFYLTWNPYHLIPANCLLKIIKNTFTKELQKSNLDSFKHNLKTNERPKEIFNIKKIFSLLHKATFFTTFYQMFLKKWQLDLVQWIIEAKNS